MVIKDVNEFLERLKDEDESNEHREALLSEARDESHKRAQVERHHYQQKQHHPHSDPEAEAHVVKPLVPEMSIMNARIEIKFFLGYMTLLPAMKVFNCCKFLSQSTL